MNQKPSAGSSKTPDITLSFACWLQKARRSRAYKLWFRTRDLYRVKIWDFGEGGAFYQRYDTQNESFEYRNREDPASHDRRISYFSERELPLEVDRPVNRFVTYSRVYPLGNTRSLATCGNCHGGGRTTCSRCGGSGRVGSGDERSRCYSCGGDGRETCSRCSGEGRLITYQSKDYHWRHFVDQEPILSPATNRLSVRGLITKVKERGGGVEVEGFSLAEVRAKIGVVNDRIRNLVNIAHQKRAEAEHKIQSRPGVVLFQELERHYVPMGFINLSLGPKYGQFFLAGTRAFAKVGTPPLAWSAWKILCWTACTAMLTLLILAFGELTQAPKHLLFYAGGACAALSLVTGLVGFLRDRVKEPPRNWLVFDDDGYGGWLFTYLYAQHQSQSGFSSVNDPCYVQLLEKPHPDTAKHRNSFMCTLVEKVSRNPRRTPIINLGFLSQQTFHGQITSLLRDTFRLTWVADYGQVHQIDARMAAILALVPEDQLSLLEVSVIFRRAGDDPIYPDFPMATRMVSDKQIRCLFLPIDAIYEESRTGGLSEENKKQFEELALITPWPN